MSEKLKLCHVNGWLDRQGKLWPCKFMEHSKKAHDIQKKNRCKFSIEYAGWIKVHCAGIWFFEADSYCDRQYVKKTKRQLRWLFNHGYDMRFC